MNKSRAKMGAEVKFCGHNVVVPADVFHVGNVCVVKANGDLNKAVNDSPSMIRGGTAGGTRYPTEDMALAHATHHVIDFPGPNCWFPERGVLIVPEKQMLVRKGNKWE